MHLFTVFYISLIDILEVTPAPNNGTKGALNHIMSQDSTLPSDNGIPLNIKMADPDLPSDFLDYGDCDVCVIDVSSYSFIPQM